jgi:hypothetical protein
VKPIRLRLPVLLAILGVTSLKVQAGFVQFTATGDSAGVPVSSTATFQTSPGELTIALLNTTSHTADAGQLMTGIRFTLSPNPDPLALLVSGSAIPRNIAEDGSYVDGAPQSLLGTWQSNLNDDYYQLDFNPNAEFAIVGPADGETGLSPGIYTGNGSINGNTGHNPFTAKSATFKLESPGIDANTVITGVSFIYNTGLSNVIPGTPHRTEQIPPIPEPATMGFGLAVLAMCGAARRGRA